MLLIYCCCFLCCSSVADWALWGDAVRDCWHRPRETVSDALFCVAFRVQATLATGGSLAWTLPQKAISDGLAFGWVLHSLLGFCCCCSIFSLF